MQKQQNFSDARIQFEKYKSLKPNDERAIIGIESCTFAMEALENPSRYELVPFQHNTNQEEYAPCFANKDYDELFFTSSRDGSLGKAKDGFTGNSFTDIYWSKYDKKKKRWSKPAPFDEPMNTSDHEAAPTLNKRGTELYFTRCMQNSKVKPSNL